MRFISSEQRKAVMARLTGARQRLGQPQTRRRIVAAAALGVGLGAAAITRKKLIPLRNPGYVMQHILPTLKGAGGPSREALTRIARVKGLHVVKGSMAPMAIDLPRVRLAGGRAVAQQTKEFAEMMEKLPKGARRLILFPDDASSATFAHELGHLRRRNLLAPLTRRILAVGRNADGGYVSLLQVLEEGLATLRGARLYKQAGGSLREYGRRVIPGQMTYIASSGGGRDAPLAAGLTAGGLTYAGLRPRKKKNRR